MGDLPIKSREPSNTEQYFVRSLLYIIVVIGPVPCHCRSHMVQAFVVKLVTRQLSAKMWLALGQNEFIGTLALFNLQGLLD